MAEITSAQAGDWSSTSTWDGGTVPGDTDSVLIEHDVDVDTDTTIGPSGATGTAAITLNASGVTLTIKTGVTLTCRGDIRSAATTGTTYLTGEAGCTLEFDSSQATDPTNQHYFLDTCYDVFDEIRVTFNGTSGSHCTIRSNASGGNARIDYTSQPNGSYYDTYAYVDFSRMGTSSDSALKIYGTTIGIAITHCSFDACGHFTRAAFPSTDSTIRVEDCIWTDTLGTYCIDNISTTSDIGTGTRTILRNVFDKKCNFNILHDFTIEQNYFEEPPVIQTNNAYASFADNIIVTRTSTTSMYAPGGASDCLLFYHKDTDNPHFFNATCGEAVDITVDGCVFGCDYNGDADGDMVQGLGVQSGNVVYITNCIGLPTASDDDTGLIMSAQGNANTTVSVTHNTGYATNSRVGENHTPHAGMVAAFKSNISYCPSASSSKYHFVDIDGTTEDVASSGDVTHNCGYNLNTGSNGYGYNGFDFSSGSPGANDITADPQFVDNTRHIPTWDIDGLGTSAGTAWATGQSYTIGDVVSYSKSGVWWDETINYRCIADHTSDSGDATDHNAPYECTNWRTNWEFATLYRLRQDVSRIPTMVTWVKNGYVPQNSSLQAAGHDGEDIGAVAGDWPTTTAAATTTTVAPTTTAAATTTVAPTSTVSPTTAVPTTVAPTTTVAASTTTASPTTTSPAVESTTTATVIVQVAWDGAADIETANSNLTIGSERFAATISVGTSEETLGLSVTQACPAYIENLDSTNYVDIGFATGDYPLRILAGEVGLLPLSPAAETIYWRANTAAVDVRFDIAAGQA